MWPPNVFCSHIGGTLGVCKLWLPGPYFFEPFRSRIGRSLGQNLGFHIYFKTSVLNSHETCFASSLEQLWEICRLWATGPWSPRGKAQWGQIFAGHISETIRPIFMIWRPYKSHLHPDAHWRVHYFLGLQGVLMTDIRRRTQGWIWLLWSIEAIRWHSTLGLSYPRPCLFYYAVYSGRGRC